MTQRRLWTRRQVLTSTTSMVLLLAAGCTKESMAEPAISPTPAPPEPVRYKPSQGSARIYISGPEGSKVRATFRVDKQSVLEIEGAANSEISLMRRPAGFFSWTPAPRELRVQGEVISSSGSSRDFDLTCPLADVAIYTAPIHFSDHTVGEKIEALSHGLAALEEDWNCENFLESVRRLPSSERIDLAGWESKLKVKYPGALREIADWDSEMEMSRYGFNPSLLDEAYTIFQGREDELSSDLPPAVWARYQRSIAAFSGYTSDGFSGLAWDPIGISPGEPANHFDDPSGARPGVEGEGVWYWWGESLLYAPVLLLQEDMKPMKAERALLAPIYEALGLTLARLENLPGEIAVDSGHPAGRILLDVSGQASLIDFTYDGYIQAV